MTITKCQKKTALHKGNKPASPDPQYPAKKERIVPFMEAAANSQRDLAKGATTEPANEREIFG